MTTLNGTTNVRTDGKMTVYADLKELLDSIKDGVSISTGALKITNKELFRDQLIDELALNASLNENQSVKQACQWIIWESSRELGIFSSSIQEFYEARGRDEFEGITVPAINIRGLTYYVAQAIIKTAMKNKSKSFIFEIAKSEIGYTFQPPAEYTSQCLAAAIKTGYIGPVFIQGDHFQVNAKKFKADPKAEITGLKNLIREAIENGFYNIDIDSSTLVDLSKPTIKEQQKDNYSVAAQLTAYIREIEPKGITVSVGGEIGEVGGKNSTPEELTAFMDGYRETLGTINSDLEGISKISVQTGTAHGGVVLPDGSIAEVKLDFNTLETLSRIAREQYGLSGAVQHGASTLPDEAFHRFPDTETAEVHLATGFQNIVYESKSLPSELRSKIYEWLKTNCAAEWKEGQTEEQFIYKTRKKGFGPFKKELWMLSPEVKEAISQELEAQFDFLFKKLNAHNTQLLIEKYINMQAIPKKIPEGLLALINPSTKTGGGGCRCCH
ncbi:MAG: class II fructose-bisphosphate aldolase [bacterium]